MFTSDGALISASSDDARQKITGNGDLTYYRSLATPNWTIVIAFPRQSLASSLQQLRNSQIALAMIAIFLSLFGVLRLIKIILKPVKRLIQAHQTVASGKLDIQLDADERSEFGSVFAAFNAMSAHLAEVRSQNRRAKEDMVTALEKAKYADEVKSRFIATMSHELRSPLQGILGAVDLIAATSDDPEMAKYTAIIRKGNERLTAIINNVLSISRLEAGKEDIHYEKLASRQWLENALREHRHAARLKGLAFHVVYDAGLAEYCWVDSEKLRYILDRILDNAIKFTTKGSVEVRVSMERETPDAAEKLRITVTDTGVGIDESIGEKLFEPFYQVESKFDRQFQGPGLGLSVAQRLLKTIGGELGFKSILGQGSSFWFVMPLLVKNDAERGDKS